MSNQFKYKANGLSEEHIKQVCRFLDKPYVKGEYQKWHKFAAFKWWHKREMEEDHELAQRKEKAEN